MMKYLSLILVVICAGGLLQGAVGRVVRRSYDQDLSADQPVLVAHDRIIMKDAPVSNYGSGDKSFKLLTKVEDQPKLSGYGSEQPAPVAHDRIIMKDVPLSNYGSGDKSFHFETKVEDQPRLSGYAKRDTYGSEQPVPIVHDSIIIKDAPASNYGGDDKSFHFETKVEDQPKLSGYAKRDSYGSEQPAPIAQDLTIIKDVPASNYGSDDKSFKLLTKVEDQPKLSGYGSERPAPVAHDRIIMKDVPLSNYGSGDKSFHFETKVEDQPKLSGYAKRDSYGSEQPVPIVHDRIIMKDTPVSSYGSSDKSFHLVTKVEDQSQY